MASKSKRIVEEYWTGAVTRVQAEVEVFNRLIGHAGEQGRQNELALATLLGHLLPRRLGIGTGLLFDSLGTRSKQTDIIIFDDSDQPTLLAQANQLLHPVECVHAVLEVKTTLTKDEIADCAEKAKSIASLSPQGARPPLFLVLAFNSELAPSTFASEIRGLPKQAAPALFCILTPGIVGGSLLAQGKQPRKTPLGLAALHAVDADGNKVPGSWVSAPAKGMHCLQNGNRYPVTSVDKVRRVGEPGRALLLFSEALLRGLAERGACNPPSIGHYLDSTARELIDL